MCTCDSVFQNRCRMRGRCVFGDIIIVIQYLYTLFTNGRQPGTNARPNMESRRFGIKICFRANFGQLTGQLTLKLSVI